MENSVSPYEVLVVDDMATNRMLVKAALPSPDYAVAEAVNGENALDLIARRQFDVVLLDVMMPGIDGFEVCRRVREMPELQLLPILMLTTIDSPENVAAAMKAGANDYINKPCNPVELMARVRAAADHKRALDRLDDTESVLFALARVVEAKDSTTGDHCDRLSHMGVVFGRELGLAYDDLEALRRGGILHDIGKLGIPESILCKKGKLDPDEWQVMKQHSTIGAELCRPLRTMRKTVDIVACHHEKWNGGGYPGGLAGNDIPLLARVFQVLDIYDALSADRPYKPAWPMDRIVETMEEEMNKGFWDPEIMPVFLDILRNRPQLLKLPEKTGHDKSAAIFEEISKTGALEWEK